MKETYYTHAMWRVEPGRETEFEAAWNELAEAFSSLEQKPLWGSLIQSVSDPTLFFSFGPWNDHSDIEAMRADAKAQAAMAKVRELCVEATPGAYRLVAHVDTSGKRP